MPNSKSAPALYGGGITFSAEALVKFSNSVSAEDKKGSFSIRTGDETVVGTLIFGGGTFGRHKACLICRYMETEGFPAA